MLEYPAKILVALGEAILGNEKILDWLLNNGYPELAAFATATRGGEGAISWLMANQPELAAMDGAIDNQLGALKWLQDNNCDFELKFAALCNHQPDAIAYFNANDLQVFVYLAEKINHFRDTMVYDVHRRPKA